MSFVQVYVGKDEMEASIAKGSLESAGIKSMISPINNNSPLNGSWFIIYNTPHGVYVEEDKAEEAKKVLAQES